MTMMKSESLRNLIFISIGMFIGFTNHISTEFIIGRDIINTSSARSQHHIIEQEQPGQQQQLQNDYDAKLARQIELYEEASVAAAKQVHILKNRYDSQLAEQARFFENKITKLKLENQQPQQNKPLLQTTKNNNNLPELPPLRLRVSVGSSLTSTNTGSGNSDGGRDADDAAVAPQFSKNPDSATIMHYPLSFYPHSLKGHDYFLPAHAIDRPAVQAFLNDAYFEPQTHCVMEKILHRFPGSMVHAGTFFGDMIPHFSTIIKNVSTSTTTSTTPEEEGGGSDSSSSSTFHLYAFEPNTRNYLLAQKAVEANELSNVILVNAALGNSVLQQRIQVEKASTPASSNFDSYNNNGDDHQMQPDGKKTRTPPQIKLLGGDSSVSPTTGTQRVPQLTIDMFNISNLSIIALDVQDYEVFVLKGAMQTLTNPATRPRVVALEDANRKRPAAAFMQEYLPDYVQIQRMDCLTYFALQDVHDEVKMLLQECS